ncbi:hypothetical protein [Oryza sativa Japonica Group]|uniref:Uncharacterized protein n=1 Tax=Oryza sativa subsp. japonica TaxID=39947 RepID=Q5NBC4_ORYSJ|nr:hypothetical protein [Oryza sativa Japonica Group]BAD81232.1 hypothetical protein [Oryza sativa Japonica Group]
MGSLGLERLVWRSMLGDVSKEELVHVQVKNEVKLARADGGGEELELEDGTLGRRSRVGQAGVVDRSSSSRTACGCCCLLVPGGRRRAGGDTAEVKAEGGTPAWDYGRVRGQDGA